MKKSKRRMGVRGNNPVKAIACCVVAVLVLAAAVEISHRRFYRRVIEQSCGVEPGMTYTNARRLLTICGGIKQGSYCGITYYGIEPRGLATLKPFAFEDYAIGLELDSKRRILKTYTTASYDF